jgi:hypothetical protein
MSNEFPTRMVESAGLLFPSNILYLRHCLNGQSRYFAHSVNLWIFMFFLYKVCKQNMVARPSFCLFNFRVR